MSMTLRSRLAQRGAVAVEAALVLIPLLILLLGIAEGGRLFFEYNTIIKTTRDATRYLSTVAPGSNAGDPTYVRARCLAVYGNETCAGSPVVSGLTTKMVEICDARDASLCPPDEPHRNVPATGNGSPPGTGEMNLVTVRVNHFQPELFIGITMPVTEFRPIGTTMRQAR
jgi:Flp pilus assembly protein TadG